MEYKRTADELIERGYIPQKLYAMEYQTYRKTINELTLWLWEDAGKIEIEDWYHLTGDIIKFYQDNLESYQVENQKLPKPSDYMVLMINTFTNDVILKDKTEYYTHLMADTLDEYEKKYKRYREVVLYIPYMQGILDEIKFLTHKS